MGKEFGVYLVALAVVFQAVGLFAVTAFLVETLQVGGTLANFRSDS